MNELPKAPTLAELQQFIAQVEAERGWDKETVVQKCLMLGEEVGELFRSVRKSHAGLGLDPKGQVTDPAEELADILMAICFIANRLDIDLETAFRDKDRHNRTRHWE